MTTNHNKGQWVVQRVTTSGKASDSEKQRVTTGDNEWQRVTKNDNEWQITSDEEIRMRDSMK